MSISMHIQNLDKFYKKGSKDIERKRKIMKEGRTNERTDKMTDNPNPIYPPFFSKRGL